MRSSSSCSSWIMNNIYNQVQEQLNVKLVISPRSSSFDINDMISHNRNIYQNPAPKEQSQKALKTEEDSSQTIDFFLQKNKELYQTRPVEQIQEQEIEEDIKQDLMQEVYQSTKIPEISQLRLLYNYKTMIKHEGTPLEDVKKLDNARIERKKRNQKDSGNQEEQLQAVAQKKKYVRLYKYFISKLVFEPPKSLKLVSFNLENQQRWIKALNMQDFGGVAPSPSIVQEKTTGRFYIYDNSCGKVHIYSSDMLINLNKDKPLVSLNMNEDIPRQNPLLYLIECEHEYQWKSVLFVIGGYHKQRGIKRPLRTIKVFEIKRREVTLTPALTITLKYPRMNPIVFDLSKSKGMYWQDSEGEKKAESGHKTVDEKYIFFMGGNPLLEFEKERLDVELKSANQTCEYVQLKLLLEHIARAKQFLQDQNQVNLGLNFGKFSIADTLNIKYQNAPVPEKIYNCLHHASVAKIQDEVFDQSLSLIVIGGYTNQTLKLQFINQLMNEIIFIGNKLQILKPALIWSASNLRFCRHVYFFDDGSEISPSAVQGLNHRTGLYSKTSCSCSVM